MSQPVHPAELAQVIAGMRGGSRDGPPEGADVTLDPRGAGELEAQKALLAAGFDPSGFAANTGVNPLDLVTADDPADEPTQEDYVRINAAAQRLAASAPRVVSPIGNHLLFDSRKLVLDGVEVTLNDAEYGQMVSVAVAAVGRTLQERVDEIRAKHVQPQAVQPSRKRRVLRTVPKDKP